MDADEHGYLDGGFGNATRCAWVRANDHAHRVALPFRIRVHLRLSVVLLPHFNQYLSIFPESSDTARLKSRFPSDVFFHVLLVNTTDRTKPLADSDVQVRSTAFRRNSG